MLGRLGYFGFVCAVMIGITWVLSLHDDPSPPPAAPITKSQASAPKAVSVSPPMQDAQPITDDQIQFDSKIAANKALFDKVEVGADACFDRSFHGLLMQGVRSRSQLLNFAEPICGKALKKIMQMNDIADSQIDAYIHLMAVKNLDLAIQEGR